MSKIEKYFRLSMVLVIAMSIVIGFSATTTQVSAQSISASFNPQTQFQTGSTLTIQSVYGMATVMPSRNQTRGNQPHVNPHANSNRLQIGNQRPQENLQMYSASITVNVQVADDTSNGGVQLAVQGGTIVINGVTFTIANGNGEISNLDRLMINGNATSVNGQTFKWNMQGLAAVYNGTVIGYLNGNASISLGSDITPTDVNVTYITTIG
jgi:hypothetical protein